MTTVKWIICVIFSALTSSYITFHLNQANKDDSYIAPPVSHLQSSNTTSMDQRQSSEKIVDSARGNLNQTAQPPTDTNTNNANQILLTQSVGVEDLQFAYEKKQNEIASFRQFIERTGNSALSVISNNYDSEPLDPEWARSKEDELLAILDTNKTLQNTAPLELSCKSQNCRLILSAQDGNQGESLYSAFKNEVLQGSDENKKQVISYFNNPDNGEVHIYLSKNTVSTLLEGKMD